MTNPNRPKYVEVLNDVENLKTALTHYGGIQQIETRNMFNILVDSIKRVLNEIEVDMAVLRSQYLGMINESKMKKCECESTPTMGPGNKGIPPGENPSVTIKTKKSEEVKYGDGTNTE